MEWKLRDRITLRPVYTGDFCCDFCCDFVAISNRPCILAAILWQFENSSCYEIAAKSPLFRTCSNLVAI